MKTRGAISVLVIVLVTVGAGLGLWAFKPKSLDGDSNRAAASAAASQRVEEATTRPAAVAAASVVKIGEVAANLPESREKDFIMQEVPVAQANLPSADPLALLAAERRKVAILTGQISEARALYGTALTDADKLRKERDAAFRARQAVDNELQQVAAERLGEQRQQRQIILFAAVCLGLFVYVKVTHVSPGALADIVTDVKEGKISAAHAFDAATSRTQQRIVSWLAHFKSKP